MRLALLVLLSIFAGLLFAQAPYTVSTGSVTYQALGSVPNTQVHRYASEYSRVFAPPGFSFTIDGQTFTEFRTCESGCIKFGNNIADFMYYPRQDYGTDFVVGGAWMSLNKSSGVSDPIRWDFTGGVLTVEWREMLLPRVDKQQPNSQASFQIELDCNTNAIEFRYGPLIDKGNMNLGAPFNVCVTGGIDKFGKPITFGAIPGYVQPNGQMDTWPTGNYVRFTPNATGAVPEFEAFRDGVVLGYSNGWTVEIGDKMADQKLSFDVTDPDNDDVMVETLMQFNGNGPGSLAPSEFESASQPVPFTLTPKTGEFEAGMYYVYITMIATDAQGGSSVFHFKVTIRDNSWIGLPPEIACSTGSGSSPLFAALLAIIAGVWLRRRNVEPCS